MTEHRAERIGLRYELHELRSGRVHHFASLAALARFIAARQRAARHDPTFAPTRTLPRRGKKRK